METEKRTKVYNVIILDKSGSMSSIARQAIDGVNETIASIKRGQELHPEQDNLLTLVAFCGCEIRKIYDQTPIGEVKPITKRDYRPCCMTPLYDAVGNTISTVHRLMEGESNAIASVTIITDGYENASKEYSHAALKSLIEAYKSEGWMFAYIGADHDVEKVAFSLNIDHHLQFDKTEEGTEAMFCCHDSSRSRWVESMIDACSAPCASPEERLKRMKEVNSNSFFLEDRKRVLYIH